MADSLAIIQKSSLRPAQRRLYELIAAKIESGDKITLQEAEQIWLSRVCRHKNKDGQPLRYDYYHERVVLSNGSIGFTTALVPMTKQEITERVLMWLTQNIGLLVIRGYLQVVPMIDLKCLPAD